LYVLDNKGETREGWPIQMGEIQAQVAVADLHRNGGLTLVASDARGNVAAFDGDGKELWERHLGTAISQVGCCMLPERGVILPVYRPLYAVSHVGVGRGGV